MRLHKKQTKRTKVHSRKTNSYFWKTIYFTALKISHKLKSLTKFIFETKAIKICHCSVYTIRIQEEQ